MEKHSIIRRVHKSTYQDYVCPYCYNTLDKCTCECSPYDLIFIDRRLQEHISILNKKGYATVGCCESHYNSQCVTLYIAFGHDHSFGEKLPLPEGFEYNKRRHMVLHEYKNNITEEEMNREKEKYIGILLEWCKNLPVFSNIVKRL